MFKQWAKIDRFKFSSIFSNMTKVVFKTSDVEVNKEVFEEQQDPGTKENVSEEEGLSDRDADLDSVLVELSEALRGADTEPAA